MLSAIRNTYAIVFTNESRMNDADLPSEMPNAAEQQASTPTIAMLRIGQLFRTFARVRNLGCR